MEPECIDRSALIAECRRRREQGADAEALLATIRRAGGNKIDSMVVLMAVLDIGLAEAKPLVHHSAVWQDRRAGDDALHAVLVEATASDGDATTPAMFPRRS